ncbi:hypothetical protein pdam_00024763 [Pocillopora damicornis]|uniref:ATP-dependent DNA helicase n=1 Tax=Pocillopora damicornis TaxID=46731 RepID=A0A3M6UPA0_POCDA|nr:hypothetical protein pdam_00024763 [Pocillopora damicornis]
MGIDDFLPETSFDNKSDDNPYSINVIERECRPNEYKLIGGMKLVKRKKPKIIGSVGHHKDKEPENHFRDTDLIKDCQTYQERFEQVKDEVVYNTCQYEYHSEILDKAINDMNNTEFDNFNNVAPNAEHINKQDCAIKEKHSELFGCFDPGKKNSIISMICLMSKLKMNLSDDVKVVETAHTGKAAFNIGGKTLHSAFKIPANRGFEYCAMNSD